MQKLRILWADDEIELLKPHILFLEERGYSVTPVMNGDDAIEYAWREQYDLILLDEMMPGKNGLQTLSEIREFNPSVPIVMVTKNEEEALMEEAIGKKITDYLTKPVNPSQIVLTFKKIFDARRITQEQLTRDYTQEFASISQAINRELTPDEWINIFLTITGWELELDRYPELGFQQTIEGLHRDCNIQFSRFIEDNYRRWLVSKDRPSLSVDVMPRCIFPYIQEGKRVVFVLIDCMRTDQWLAVEDLLYDYFQVSREYYFSILPTATPYSRNAVFSGYFPDELEQRNPDLWQRGEEDENSSNRFEHQFLSDFIKRSGFTRQITTKYVKILDAQEAHSTEKHLPEYIQSDLVCLVVNFVDMLGHRRTESDILKELAPDEPAYRSLIRSWFEYSALFSILRTLAHDDIAIVISTDHGSIRGKRPSRIIGDRETSTSLRYKFGKNLQCNPKQAIHIKNPGEYRLPQRGINTHYVIAKEDFYLIYPNDFNTYAAKYKDCFHHGGVSIDEMILPVVTLSGLKR
jgi:DNA-binding response OmpR family regulator